MAAAEGQGQSSIVVDADSLSTSDVVLGDGGASLVDSSGKLVALNGARGWLRRLAPEDWRDGAVPGTHGGVVRSAWLAALLALVSAADVDWLSEMGAIYAAEDKLVQQRACRKLGVPYPPTVMVTRRQRIPLELGGRLVVKPLAAGHYLDASGAGRVVHTTEMRREDERLDLLGGAPFLVQRLVDARTHLRVVTVGRQAWVCELDAVGMPLDWRANAAAHSSFRRSDRPAEAHSAVALAHRLGVRYSSQDWVVDAEGRAHFLDLNPAGQWLFLPNEVSDAVTRSISAWLVGEDLDS